MGKRLQLSNIFALKKRIALVSCLLIFWYTYCPSSAIRKQQAPVSSPSSGYPCGDMFLGLILTEYLEHYKFPELTKLKKFVLNVEAWKDVSVLGCAYAMRAAPHLKEFELKVSIKFDLIFLSSGSRN
ncbi:hypothetical protein HAX54_030234 [Datura stramonium]|uniref:Uncharacterized protein n=1 Tax=Datura stramonium TaxID=4076 RepID=A0ABS8SAU0_DATST|nr:hypothetical protein [Datura stramonium]